MSTAKTKPVTYFFSNANLVLRNMKAVAPRIVRTISIFQKKSRSNPAKAKTVGYGFFRREG